MELESKHVWQFNEIGTLADLREAMSIVDGWDNSATVEIYAGGMVVTNATE